MTGKTATIKEIAKILNVSVSTVSDFGIHYCLNFLVQCHWQKN